MITVDREFFEALVSASLDTLPADLAEMMENVVVLVEDEAPSDDPDLLGLYMGVPLTERGTGYAGSLPDTVTIYRLPILRTCSSESEVIEQVRVTVVHEIAHHFGIDDDRLAELGYD